MNQVYAYVNGNVSFVSPLPTVFGDATSSDAASRRRSPWDNPADILRAYSFEEFGAAAALSRLNALVHALGQRRVARLRTGASLK
jgi:hypothetical protein